MKTTAEKFQIARKITELRVKNRRMLERIETNKEKIKKLKEILYKECEIMRGQKWKEQQLNKEI